MDTIDYLLNKLNNFNPDDSSIFNASGHRSQKIKNDLFFANYWLRRNAEGLWYEALIYEYLKEISINAGLIKGVIKKDKDAKGKSSNPKIGQNGFFYDKKGKIILRGNGQDLAEIDIIILDNNIDILFLK